MPYIKKKDRAKFQQSLEEIWEVGIKNPGELNYIFTCLSKIYLNNKGIKYQHFNDIIGALEGAKLEMYRRQLSTYEDEKIQKNGDVHIIPE